MEKIRIDVVSDVVCPWCYIGKRRFEKALHALRNEFEFEVVYRPFELNPAMPSEGRSQKEYLVAKFGSEEQYNSVTSQVAQVAKSEGLVFDFDRQLVAPNTRRLHSIIQAGKTEGIQLELTEAFFKAYFTDGVDLSQDENIISVAENAGLSTSLINTTLTDESAVLQVALEEQEMYKLGISGVPFYIINNRFGISGAQSTETFIQALNEVSVSNNVDGESCDVTAKNC